MFVFAEVRVTEQMRKDPKSVIVSDTGVFLVTTEENSQHYPFEEFHPTTRQAVLEYVDQCPEVADLLTSK